MLMRLIKDGQQHTDHSLLVDSPTAEIKEHPDSFLTVCYDSVVDAQDKQTGQPLSGQMDISVSTAMSELNSYEQLEEVHRELRDGLADELLIILKGMSPARFETLVVNLLERMGYGEGESVGRSGDGGIDGIINQDPLGLEKVYIQAKRWQSQVGEPEIRNFSGSLEAKGASKGVFITTSTFSSTARQTAQFISAGNKFIRLIDGGELAGLMIRHGVGVVTEMTYEVKKIDENYFVDL